LLCLVNETLWEAGGHSSRSTESSTVASGRPCDQLPAIHPTHVPSQRVGFHLSPAGPTFELSDYLTFIEREGPWSPHAPKRMPSPVVPGLLRFAKALLCMALHLWLVEYFSADVFETSWFYGLNLPMRSACPPPPPPSRTPPPLSPSAGASVAPARRCLLLHLLNFLCCVSKVSRFQGSAAPRLSTHLSFGLKWQPPNPGLSYCASPPCHCNLGLTAPFQQTLGLYACILKMTIALPPPVPPCPSSLAGRHSQPSMKV